MKFTFLLFFLSLAFTSFAQSPLKLVNPNSVAAPKGYSQVAQIDLGNATMLLISGQVPLDKQGNLVGKGDLARQTEQVFINIKNIIEEAGGNINHLAKVSYFIKDVSKIQLVRDMRDKFINTQSPPASTLVEVSKLYRDDVLIEIEATAVIPKK
ncbi:RidA family protein [Emticicia sp. C21]|uniref:RidA family protein n=1 Tax=Emticicia sp. C21 TaxID=2302915 RepID=UPI000E34B7F9|nr:RidA family protein [Emticicia sp. C21]RFS13714.1 RidA family protein [Emticicia sp. C21]